MTQQELEQNGYKVIHTGSKRGYVSRKSTAEDRKAYPYKGKYGEGYTVDMPRWDTTSYCNVAYYTLNDEGGK